MRRVILAMAVVVSGGAVAADPIWMSEDEIAATFKGRSIDGEYEDGAPFHETYAADGPVTYRDGRHRAGGRWSVRAGTLCTIYDDDPTGGCFRVRRVGENCFEFHFVARTEAEAAKNPRRPDWTARGWFPERPRTCSSDDANV